MTDPIADYLTRIRNAYLAGKKIVEIPSSKMKAAITKILCEKGYILSYKIVEGTPLQHHQDRFEVSPSDQDGRHQENQARVNPWYESIFRR